MMTDLRQKRRVLGLSQERLAQRTGIAVRRLSRYERGTLEVPPDHLRLLALQLGLDPEPPPEMDHRCVCNLENWAKLVPLCEDLGLPALPAEFQEQVPCTPMQAIAWCQLQREGAQVGAASPVDLGFDLHPIVDVGRCPEAFPCLSWQSFQARYVLWPHLRLRTPDRCYLVDALVLAVDWQGAAWAVLKLDGPQNDWDSRIHEHLQVRLLQILPADVFGLKFARRVERLMESVPKWKKLDWHW